VGLTLPLPLLPQILCHQHLPLPRLSRSSSPLVCCEQCPLALSWDFTPLPCWSDCSPIWVEPEKRNQSIKITSYPQDQGLMSRWRFSVERQKLPSLPGRVMAVRESPGHGHHKSSPRKEHGPAMGHPKEQLQEKSLPYIPGGWDSAEPRLSQSAMAKPTTGHSLAYCSPRHHSSSHHVHWDMCMGMLAWRKRLPEAFERAVCGLVKAPDRRTVQMPPAASAKVIKTMVRQALPKSRNLAPLQRSCWSFLWS